MCRFVVLGGMLDTSRHASDTLPTSGAAPSRYRADIDGLRAISVTLVLLYHLGVGFARGGYFGVDVFFVISGYLITGIILKEAKAGHFSFAGFYERRIRRLAPVLFAVLLASAAAAPFVLLPPEIEKFGGALLAALLFAANYFYAADTGYFTNDADFLPLLHTWSLAVEEQFYLFFPPLLLLLLRWRHIGLKAVLWLILLGSLAASVYLAATTPEIGFFVLPARAWELAAGAVLAAEAVPRAGSQRVREIGGGIGLLAILVAGTAIASKNNYMALGNILPCLGAALVIWSGAEGATFASRLLSAKPLVFLGKISYALYLWHFPLIVFAKVELGVRLPVLARIGIAAASFALAVLSWRYVEIPVRSRAWPGARMGVFAAAAGGLAVMASFGGIYRNASFLLPPPPGMAGQLAAFRYHPEPGPQDACFVQLPRKDGSAIDATLCLQLDPARPNYLILGDSHAAHLVPGLAFEFPGIHFLQPTVAGCKPFIGGRQTAMCRKLVDYIFNEFLPTHHVDAIVLAGYWMKSDIAGLQQALQNWSKFGVKLYLVGPVMTYQSGLPMILARAAWRDNPGFISRERMDDRRPLDQQMRSAVKGLPVSYISPIQALCTADDCTTLDDRGNPIQWDYGHLTQGGSRLLARKLHEQGLFP